MLREYLPGEAIASPSCSGFGILVWSDVLPAPICRSNGGSSVSTADRPVTLGDGARLSAKLSVFYV